MDSLPKHQAAIVGHQDGHLVIDENVPLPDMTDPHTILIRNQVAGLNPVDVKMTGPLGTPGAIAGTDFAGTILAVGELVHAAAPLQPGDRVCGAVLGMHPLSPRVGAFAQYVVSMQDAVLKLPESMTLEEGASLGSGISTVGLALFRSLQLPGYPYEPAEKSKAVLVYGASSATGTLALQIIKLSGFRPIATCSPHNFDLVKSCGAEEVFDYRSSTAVADIKQSTKNSLKYVLDCISEPDTMQFCYECIGRLGGRYTALEPFPQWLANRPNVTPDWVMGSTLFGTKLGYKAPFDRPADPELRRFAAEWFKTVQRLLDDGKLRMHPLHVMSGGLRGILEGTELVRKKQVSGYKLVYRMD